MATVLVVDDRSINREFLGTLLGYVGYRTLEAGDGAEALAVARAERPDLVISDILMPTMDGVELAGRLRNDPGLSDVPIIFYTATYRLSEARELAEGCAVASVLAKPSEPQVILGAVAAALGRAPEEVPATVGPRAPGSTLELEPPAPHGLIELERVLRRALDARLAADPGSLTEPQAAVFSLSLRLAALLEVGLVLPTEREPQKLLELFCRAARDLMNASYAVVAMGAEVDRPRRVAIHGMSPEEASRLSEALDLDAGIFGAAVASGRPLREVVVPGELPAGIPAVHPPVRSLVVAPILSGSRTRGWLYLADKVGAAGFGADDEQVAATLAAQIAPVYDNLVLYGELEAYARDLERQRDHIARLTRVHAVLSGINAAIVRIHDRNEMLQKACRIAVTGGAYQMAWVGMIEAGADRAEVVAHAGGEAAYLETVELTLRPGTPASERPGSRVLREGRPVVCNDIVADPLLAPLEAKLLASGYRSVAAFPLTVEGRTVGVLALYGAEAGRFDDEEMTLLTEVAGDISFGLQYIEKEERLAWLAYYDALTGLPNAALFQERLGQHLKENNGQRIAAVLLVDLDRFTQLNDTFGRHVGDELLRGVAGRLERELPEPRLVARTGADTFAVMIAGLGQGTDAAPLLEQRVLAVLSRPFPLDGSEIRITARAGIALHPEDGTDAATLFKNAEAALKRAQAGGERYRFYSPEITARAAERLELEGRLRGALESEQFVLHYQPKVRAVDGRPAGLEALIRWQDPAAGLIPPGKFIPVLEATGMIAEVGRWALDRALADYQLWRREELEPPRVGINVSPFELAQHDFPVGVEEALRKSGAVGQALELEITESVIMEDIEATIAVLRRIGGLGVAIAIDDFGTGHSSLRYLAKLPVQSLKIDRVFIAGMMTDPDSMSIVSAVISLAHALDLAVVAEGVETEEQAKFLRLMKCDEMQGFLFSPAMPFDDVAEYLQATGKFRMR